MASAAVLLAVPRESMLMPAPLGNRNDCRLCWLASTRIEMLAGGLAWPGATRANWSSRFSGFSTEPDDLQRPAPSCQTLPTCRPKVVATLLVTATWSGAGRVAPGVEPQRHADEGPVGVLGSQVDGGHRTGHRDALVGDHVDGAEPALGGGDVGGQVGIRPGQAEDGVGRPERGVGAQLGGVGDDGQADRGGGHRHGEQDQDQRLAAPFPAEHPPGPADHGSPGRGPTVAGALAAMGAASTSGGHGFRLGARSDSGPGGGEV